MGLFESDQDLDATSDVEAVLIKHLKKAHAEISDEYSILHDEDPARFRKLLDDGICDKLFTEFRAKYAKDNKDPARQFEAFYSRYNIIILTALMMKAGATIKADDLEAARQIHPQIQSRPGFALPLGDFGYRDPGKAQVGAALDLYQNGQPREFGAPSCFKCGKMDCDLTDEKLLRCTGCKGAWYCNKECQKANWKQHKIHMSYRRRPQPSRRVHDAQRLKSPMTNAGEKPQC